MAKPFLNLPALFCNISFSPPATDAPGPEDDNTPDWLRQAAVAKAKPAKHRQAAARQQQPGGGRKAAGASPLSWMSSMKRRSSMDLEDADVQAAIAQAKAKAVPGGWLQIGALGAPDAVAEETELEEARAASYLAR